MGKKRSKSSAKRAETQVSQSEVDKIPSVFGAGRKRREAEKSDNLIFLVVIGLFFASGFSSLIYQVVWTRMLVLIFGATTFATSTVLSIFMGGLALGSFLAGRVSDRVSKPLLWYGILEGVIGIWALIAPLLFDAATPLYKMIWQQTHAEIISFSLLRFVATCVILIVPTTCMGATLPLLSRFVTKSLDYVGNRVGTLYSVNTLGAVCGAMGAGFILLPTFGLSVSTWISAAINFVLLVVVVLLSIKTKENVEKAEVQDSGYKRRLPLPVVISIIAFAISGGIAMVYEVCWTRALLMVIGSSTYAFTVMLTAFLIGIFVGSLVCSMVVDRAKNPFIWFAMLQLSVGALTLISMRLFNQIPYWNLVVNEQLFEDPGTSMAFRFMMAGLVMTPTTLCLGAIFPVVVKACTTELALVGRSVGSIYSANTVGAIIGAFMAGFVLLPMFGSEQTLLWGAILNFWVGLVVLWAATNLRKPLILATIASVAIISIALRTGDMWDKNILLTAQAERRSLAVQNLQFPSYQAWQDTLRRYQRVLFWEDGPCSNVGVIYHTLSKHRSLVTNGHVDASDSTDMPVQSLISGFPLLLKPDAKDLAVIGWGSGQTVGTAIQFPVRSIEAVELEPAVVKASRLFFHVNHEPENDPRVHVQYNDGRNFLLATDQKFDMIVSEPSNPWQAGVCNLFTKEYFQICKQRLKPHGTLAIWMQNAEVPPANMCGVFAAVNAVFPHAIAFAPRTGNIVIIASEDPIVVKWEELKKQFADPKIKKEFESVYITEPASVIGHIIMASDGFKRVIADAYLNTDDRNRLEFDVGKTYENRAFIKENLAILASLSGQPWKQVDWGNASREEKSLAMSHIAQASADVGQFDLSLAWAQMSNEQKENANAWRVIGMVASERKETKRAEEYYRHALTLEPNNTNILNLLGNLLCTNDRREEGRKLLFKSMEINPNNKMTKFILGGSYNKELRGAPLPEKEAADPDPNSGPMLTLKYLEDLGADRNFCREHPTVLFLLAEANFKLRLYKTAKAYLQNYNNILPNSKMGKKYMEVLNTYASGGTVEELEHPTAAPPTEKKETKLPTFELKAPDSK
jgi:spermidine synthase